MLPLVLMSLVALATRPDPRLIARPQVRSRAERAAWAPGRALDTWCSEFAPPVRAAGSAPDGASTPQSAAWTEVAPPQRSFMLLLPDPARRRLVMASGSAGQVRSEEWTARWAITTGPSRHWERIEDEADGTRPKGVVATAHDSRIGRWILMSTNEDGSLAVHTLEPAERPRWTRLPVEGSPAPRAGLGMSAVFDSRRNRVLVFGGLWYEDGWKIGDDVWSLELEPTPRWRRLTPLGPASPPRYGHEAAYDSLSDRMIVIGGYTPDQEFDHATAAISALELGDSTRWSPLAVVNGAPSIASAGTLLSDPVTGDLVLFSAHDTSFAAVGDWRLALRPDPTWSPIQTTSPTSEPHAEFVASYDANTDRFIGILADRAPSDTVNLFAFALRPEPSWTPLGAGELPSPRFGHASMVDASGDRAFVFGGVAPSDPSKANLEYLNDVWSVSLADPGAWKRIDPVDGSPSPRHEPAGIYDPIRRRLVVFGGWRIQPDESETFLDDLWVLDLDGSPRWTQVVATGGGPSGRRGHTAVLDPLRDRMIVFGGATASGYPGETWALHLADPMRWELLASEEDGPGGRWEPGMVLDPARDRLVLSGGSLGKDSHRGTWTFSLGEDRWSELPTLGYSPAYARQGATWDPVGDRMIAMGGIAAYGDVITVSGGAWAFEPTPQPTWTFMGIGGDRHYATLGSTAIYDPRRDRILCFGGSPGLIERSNETWLLELSVGIERRAWLLGAVCGADGPAVTWQGADGSGVPAAVERRGLTGPWAPFATITSDDGGRWRITDPTATPGRTWSYRLVLGANVNDAAEAEVTIDVPAASTVELLGAVPSPARGGLSLAFRVAAPQPVAIELFDLAGRRVWGDSFAFAAAQTHVVRVEAPLPPGVYLARMKAAARVLSKRVVVVRP